MTNVTFWYVDLNNNYDNDNYDNKNYDNKNFDNNNYDNNNYNNNNYDNSNYDELINRLEGVQHNVMYNKRILSFAHLSFNDRLTYLGLQRLEARRLIYFDLLYLSRL